MTTPTTMQERFDERFPHKIAEVVDDFGSSVKQDFRAFIQSEIELAVKKRDKEIVEWARTKKDKLIMKWENDKAKSTVYDSIIFGWDDYPLLITKK